MSTGTSLSPEQQQEFRRYLTCVPLFATISERSLSKLIHACRWRRYERGDFVFLQGDAAYAAFVVCNGWVVISLNSSDGRELVINEMRAGDIFGENSLIGDTHRTATAIARETTELLEVPRAAFMTVLDDEPGLVRRMLEIAVGRLIIGNHRESALAFLNAPARIARLLREMDEMDRRTNDKGYVTLSQEELAQRTGLSRQTVARFLGQWRRRGWLLTGRGRVMLLNRVALKHIEDQSS